MLNASARFSPRRQRGRDSSANAVGGDHVSVFIRPSLPSESALRRQTRSGTSIRVSSNIVAGALALAPLWEYALHDYQRNRVLAFINPALDPATAWQPRQAMNAVGSGRFIGKGFLQGTQIRLRSLPALWTDFPFAVWAEEWGFNGCTAVLIAYALLVLWVLKIGREARDRFGITVCVGVASMLFWQVAVNIGMVTGLLPVVGVTLPLISYGGSSALTVMLALGLVMNVSVRRFAY